MTTMVKDHQDTAKSKTHKEEMAAGVMKIPNKSRTNAREAVVVPVDGVAPKKTPHQEEVQLGAIEEVTSVAVAVTLVAVEVWMIPCLVLKEETMELVEVEAEVEVAEVWIVLEIVSIANKKVTLQENALSQREKEEIVMETVMMVLHQKEDAWMMEEEWLLETLNQLGTKKRILPIMTVMPGVMPKMRALAELKKLLEVEAGAPMTTMTLQ